MDGDRIEELQRENEAQRAQLDELLNGARDGGVALNTAQKVRDQLLEKLQIEEEKTAQFAQMLDLTREFTPKYYDTVRILLDEARVCVSLSPLSPLTPPSLLLVPLTPTFPSSRAHITQTAAMLAYLTNTCSIRGGAG